MDCSVVVLILDDKPFTFWIYKIDVGSSLKYFIQAVDTDGIKYTYSMEMKGGEWKLAYATRQHELINKNERKLSQILHGL